MVKAREDLDVGQKCTCMHAGLSKQENVILYALKINFKSCKEDGHIGIRHYNNHDYK